MNGNLLRSTLAALVGILVAFALLWVAQFAGSELSPDVYDPSTSEILIPIASTTALFVGWLAGTFAGSWLAMRISGGAGAGWTVAGAVIGASLYRAATLSDEWWVMILSILIPVTSAWAAQRATATSPPMTAPAA